MTAPAAVSRPETIMALRAGLMSVPMVTVILMPPHQRVRRESPRELERAGESSRFGIGARTHHTWSGKPNPMRAGQPDAR